MNASRLDGEDFQFQETALTLSPGTTQILNPDSTRWYLLIANGGSNTTWVSTLPTVGSNKGYPVTQAGYPLLLDYPTARVALQQGWWASTVGNPTLTIIEVFYRPSAAKEAINARLRPHDTETAR